MEKEYIFKIKSSKLKDKTIGNVKKLLTDNDIDFKLEINTISERNKMDKKVIFYYTNGYSDNCLEFNDLLGVQDFNEIYPTIIPMYTLNKDDYSLITNFTNKDFTEEILEYCKNLYEKRITNNN